MVDYVQHMAKVMPHWQLQEYGLTTEGRPLLGLIMSSPDNMSQLDELKADNMRRVSDGMDGGERVAWVYLSYNVHGNEAVCTEAAMATIEALATTHAQLLNGTRKQGMPWWAKSSGAWLLSVPPSLVHLAACL